MKKILIHLFLIGIIIVTLFPLFWLVTASFRGDNAVFSSHVLPQRWTLYNYREILFPEKNIPSLMNDFNSALYSIGSFSGKSEKERKNYITNNLPKFHSLTKETLNLLTETEKRDKYLSNNLNEEKVKKDIFGWLKNLNIKKPTLDSTNLNAAVYETLKNLYVFHKKDEEILKWYSTYLKDYNIKSSMVYPRIKPYVIFRKQRTAYDSYFSEMKNFKSQQRDLKDLDSKIENLKSKLSEDNSKLSTIKSELKEIDDFVANYIKNLSTAEEVLLKTKSINPSDKESYQKMIKITENIKDLLPEQKDFPNLGKLLSIANKLVVYKPSFDFKSNSIGYIFDDFVQKYNIIYRRIEEAEVLFISMKKYENDIKSSTVSLKNLEDQYNIEKKEFSKLEKSVIEKQAVLDKFYAYTLYKFAIDTENLQGLSSVFNEIIKYSGINSKDALSYQMKLNNFIRMKTAISQLVPVIKKMEDQIKRIDSNINNFSNRYDTYFVLSKAGINKFTSPYLDSALAILNNVQNVTLPTFNRHIKAIDNSLKSLGRGQDKELLEIKDRMNHVYNKKVKHEFVRWIFNTIIVATISGIIVTMVVAITAYPFSRFRFKGRKSGLISFLIIQMFPTVMAMVAFYNIVKFLGSVFPFIGLNTLGGLVLVYLGGIAYNTWLAKGYYDTVPKSLEEAALIDGANRFQTFWIIIFPLVRPILTVIFIFTFIGAFNDFVMPKILLQDQDLYTYAIGLYQFVTGPYETEWGLFSAASLIGAAPIAIVFMLLQNFLVSGLTKGAVKG